MVVTGEYGRRVPAGHHPDPYHREGDEEDPTPVTPTFEPDALVLVVGAAGSGKSTWASSFDNGVVSTDACRALVGENQRDMRASAAAFELVAAAVASRLGRGLFTLVDSTGLDIEQRERWLSLAREHGRPIHLAMFDVPAAVCRERNRNRPDPVPRRVVDTQVAAVRDLLADPASIAPDAHVTVLRTRPERATVAASATPTSDPSFERPAHAVDRPLRIGLHLSDIRRAERDGSFGDVVEWARLAEEVGVDAVWLMDHLVQIPQVGRRWDPILEPTTTLAAISTVTRSLGLGVLVSPVTFHEPATLAKRLTTLDVVSGGRVSAGLGLGWFEAEHDGAGLRFGPPAARRQRLRDMIGALRALWGPGSKPFESTSFSLPDTTSYPRPVRGSMPIVVGGNGSRTLRIAAELADGANLTAKTADLPERIAVFERHLADLGVERRDRTVSHLSTVLAADDAGRLDHALDRITPPRRSRATIAAAVNAATTDQHVARLQHLHSIGVDEVMLAVADLGEPGSIERLGAVVAAYRASEG